MHSAYKNKINLIVLVCLTNIGCNNLKKINIEVLQVHVGHIYILGCMRLYNNSDKYVAFSRISCNGVTGALMTTVTSLLPNSEKNNRMIECD